MTDQSETQGAGSEAARPNILLILSDEYRFPRYFDTPEFGMKEAMKYILGFQGDDADIAGYAKYFPGLVSLRKNAVVLRNHTIAASACTPSRATMFTGQYGTRTGVTQTDGLFKSGDDATFPWLQPGGIPTVGNWLRADGYETHYFGKCHFANPPDHSLEKFGFGDWELSYPEPHGSAPNNMGLYRDYGFTDLVTTFLRRKGLALDYDRESAEGNDDPVQKPWFAVASYTNPHDITTYPMLPSQVDPEPKGASTANGERAPFPIPDKGARSVPPENGSWELDLNPDGFPQDNASFPKNWAENLYTNNKPDCQYEYSLKLAMALGSKPGKLDIAKQAPKILGLPFQLTSQPKEWVTSYMQYYSYLHYALDHHINAVMKALKETGQDKNTIVIFTTDHGEYGGAHGSMVEKWHTAYQEALHVPLVVNFPVGDNAKPQVKTDMTQHDQVTSHIDLVPTLLGLAGIDAERRAELAQTLKQDGFDVPALVGADLSGLLDGSDTGPVKDPDGTDRDGILFITDDMITEPLKGVSPPNSFDIYQQAVESFIETTDPQWKPLTENLYPGSVVQPNNLRCVRQKDWKLTRYFDPGGEKADQWELYNLDTDPNEMDNLLIYNAETFPTANVPEGHPMTRAEIEAKATELKAVLDALSEKMLSPE